MADYQPDSRRSIAAIFRQTANGAVAFCVKRNISPDTVSYLSIVSSAAAGVCFWQSQDTPALLIIAVAFCYLRLWLNMLDGMVALGSGKASRRGEVINELPDRISDVLIFVGVAHSGLCQPLIAYWVTILALLVAYIGILGQAVRVQREFSGVMSKPWRMVALHIGAWTTLALLWWGDEQIVYGGLTVLDWTLILIIAGCIQTMVVRLVRIMRALDTDDTGHDRADGPSESV